MKCAQETPGFLHLHSLSGGAEWLHLCIRHRETSSYLMDVEMLDDLVVDAMIEEDTRSRVRVRDDGVLVLLKAMHVRSDMAEPENMVSIRIWIDEKRIITTREADVDPILELSSRISGGTGPETPGEFLADLVAEHLDEIDEHIEHLEDSVDRIESMITSHRTEEACPNMASIQTSISGFLRHLGPQRPVLERLTSCGHALLSDRDRTRLDDGLNQLLRYIETLQSLRDRIDILNDRVTRIQDRQLNRSSYIFAVAATIFLPLDFITGLFGVNLMGIPLEEKSNGFLFLAVICVVLAGALMAFFKARKWL